ncbi:MAG: hypothetical protein KatS3mg031_3131 [Chitinophagales bacterium]|nr:MAG: hypothetical protein KatS3mg031_3131 [Chitinophagales bacterium]
MNKRALYYCRVNRDERSNTGLVRKCLGQVEGLCAAGFDVDMLWLCDDGVLLNEKLVIRTPWKIKPHTWWCYAFYYLFMHGMILRRVILAGYELFFARYELSHPMLLRFLKRFRAFNPNARMVMEIPLEKKPEKCP